MGEKLIPKKRKKSLTKTSEGPQVEIIEMTDKNNKIQDSVEKSKPKKQKKRKSGTEKAPQTSPKKLVKVDEHKKQKKQTPVKQTDETVTIKKKKKNSGKNKKGKFVTVFVGGLDTKVSRETIIEFFTKNGIGIFEVRKKGGRRFCHVDLLNPDDVDKALKLNGKKIDGTKVKINTEKVHFDVKEIEVKSQTIFIKNIESTVSKDAIRDLFPDAINIKYPKTMSGQNKGFAYVKMDSIDKVKEYLQKNKNLQLKGQRLILDTVEKGTRHSKILRVRNMNFTTTQETLQEVFTDSISCKMCTNNAGKSLGTAIVTFETIEGAKKAQKEFHKQEVDGRNIVVTFVEDEEKPEESRRKIFGKEDRWGRKKSSAYEKRKKPHKIVKNTDGKQKLFKK